MTIESDPNYTTVVRSATLSIPGLIAEYARLPAGNGPSITKGDAVGVAFTPQHRAVWDVGRAQHRARPFAPRAVFVVPAEGLEWAEWSDVSESVEMWIEPGLLASVSEMAGGPSRVAFDYHEGLDDPVIANVASLVRESLVAGDPDEQRLGWLPVFLATHVLERYQGLRFPRSGRIRKLGTNVLGRVAEYIDANLHRPLDILELAQAAGLSAHHFAKAFKLATGSPPHAFVAARRMERALILLQQTDLPISRVARLAGFESLTHFRANFRRAWGEPTATYRRPGRPRRMP